jgi:predicted TIM-barrel fold metal-dependent hydrolase
LEQFVPYERNTRAPVERAPEGSCDTHFHVFGDPSVYPATASASYAPPDATIDDLERMHAALGVRRGVICQPTIYGTDHRLLVDLLSQHKGYRGIGIIDDSVDEKALEKMHQAGVRAVRFNFARFLNIVPSLRDVKRAVERVAPLGWHVKIHGEYDELPEYLPYLKSLEIPVVIDHMGRLDFAKGRAQPGYALVMELLARDNWWVMLCNGDRFSGGSHPWSDTIDLARALFDAAPDRTIWATDWPHVRYRRRMPNDADLLELLYSYLPDAEARQKVLVDNPARLYGFRADE